MKPLVVVLGAGISGLTTAWYLKQKFADQIELKILEKSTRAGGWIQSIRDQGFLFEQGPRSCRSKGSGAVTLELVENLGLQDQLIPADESAHTRYLFRRGALQKLPYGLGGFIKSPFKSLIASALIKDMFAPRGKGHDESIASFVKRRFGDSLAAEFVDPFISGIYAGDINQLSVRACFSGLAELEDQYRSLLLGQLRRPKKQTVAVSLFVQEVQKSDLFTFKNGMETLPLTLASHLQKHIAYNSYPTQICSHEDGIELVLNDGTRLKAAYVVSTVSAQALAEMVEAPTLKELLEQIPFESIAAVNLGYHSKVLKLTGFGYLVPSKEKERILGVVWDSSAFPLQNAHTDQTRLTVMIGGAHFRGFESVKKENFVEMALEAVSRHLGIQVPPDAIQVKVAAGAIPQYIVGYQERLTLIRQELARFSARMSCLGNSFDGLSVNDCIMHAKEWALGVAKVGF